MNTWLGRIRRTFLLALAWAAAWAPLGVIVGLIVDSDGAMDEPWIAVGAYPGFLCAIVFAVLVGLTARRRKLDELSSSRAAVLGALSGLLVIVPVFTAALGTPNTAHPFYIWRVAIMGAVTLLSSISAVASVLVARNTKKRALV